MARLCAENYEINIAICFGACVTYWIANKKGSNNILWDINICVTYWTANKKAENNILWDIKIVMFVDWESCYVDAVESNTITVDGAVTTEWESDENNQDDRDSQKTGVVSSQNEDI